MSKQGKVGEMSEMLKIFSVHNMQTNLRQCGKKSPI